jgi:hypothetical protein
MNLQSIVRLLIILASVGYTGAKAQVRPLVVDSLFNDIFSIASFGNNYYVINNKYSKAALVNFQAVYNNDSSVFDVIALNRAY